MNTENIELTKDKITSYFRIKRPSHKQFKTTYALLRSISSEDPLFFNINMGQLLIKNRKFQKAKEYFSKALELDSKNHDAYYNLYILNVRTKDYKEAQNYLLKSREFSPTKMDIQLPYSLLNAIIDLNTDKDSQEKYDYSIAETTHFGSFEAKETKFKNLINKIIHFYNNKAYNDMELALIELNKEAIKNNYPIEITSIRLLTKELQNMVKRNTLEKNISNINNIPLDNIKDTINLAHKQRIVNTQQLLLLIDKMIDTDLQRAATMLSTIKNTNLETEIFYLKSKIEERANYLGYDNQTKENYNNFLTIGRNYLTNELFEEAYYTFEAGLYLTGDNIFNYYIGKTLNRANNQEESIPYFLAYIEKGGQKYSKALLYLSSYFKYHKQNIAYEYGKKLKKISSIFHDDFIYKDNSWNQREKNEYDHKKFVASKTIKMDLTDFEEEKENLKLENYYDYDFSKKLKVIKKLLASNNIKIANKLLKKLKPQTIDERNQLQQFERNKTLYRNRKG